MANHPHLHKWQLFKVKPQGICGEIGIRQCVVCGKTDVEELHLLGHRPTEYCHTWATLTSDGLLKLKDRIIFKEES